MSGFFVRGFVITRLRGVVRGFVREFVGDRGFMGDLERDLVVVCELQTREFIFSLVYSFSFKTINCVLKEHSTYKKELVSPDMNFYYE